MEDCIKEIKEEDGEATITYKSGVKKQVPIKTIYTIWESGKKDCNIIMEKPIDFGSGVIK